MGSGGFLAALVGCALAAAGCGRPLVHPCSKDFECAVGWSCIAGTCAIATVDAGTESAAPDVRADTPLAERPDAERPDSEQPDTSDAADTGDAPDTSDASDAPDASHHCHANPGVMLCTDRAPCQIGHCDPSTGGCLYENAVDGTTCDDGVACTDGDACASGICQGNPIVPVVSGDTITLTCPPQATAVDGYVTPTCIFIQSFEPNNVYTGPVYLRPIMASQINPLGNGSIQVSCTYANGDGLGIGGIFAVVFASSCTATADSFVCMR